MPYSFAVVSDTAAGPEHLPLAAAAAAAAAAADDHAHLTPALMRQR